MRGHPVYRYSQLCVLLSTLHTLLPQINKDSMGETTDVELDGDDEAVAKAKQMIEACLAGGMCLCCFSAW